MYTPLAHCIKSIAYRDIFAANAPLANSELVDEAHSEAAAQNTSEVAQACPAYPPLGHGGPHSQMNLSLKQTYDYFRKPCVVTETFQRKHPEL